MPFADETYVIALPGEWDAARYQELLVAIKAAPEEPGSILIDLDDTMVLDSTILGTLLLAKRDWDRRGIPCATFAHDPHVNRLLTIANVIDRLNVFHDLDQALYFLALLLR